MAENEAEHNAFYRAPKAEADVPVPDVVDDSQPFYVVALPKFFILFVATFGMYSLVWFAKHWRRYRDRTGRRLRPVPRAIFALFYTHSLFSTIYTWGMRSRESIQWRHGLMATLYVLLTAVSTIIGRVAARRDDFGPLDWLGIVVGLLAAYPLSIAQNAANVVCGDPNGDSNHRMTLVNLLFIVLGAILWLFAFVGTFALEA